MLTLKQLTTTRMPILLSKGYLNVAMCQIYVIVGAIMEIKI